MRNADIAVGWIDGAGTKFMQASKALVYLAIFRPDLNLVYLVWYRTDTPLPTASLSRTMWMTSHCLRVLRMTGRQRWSFDVLSKLVTLKETVRSQSVWLHDHSNSMKTISITSCVTSLDRKIPYVWYTRLGCPTRWTTHSLQPKNMKQQWEARDPSISWIKPVRLLPSRWMLWLTTWL